MLEVNVTYQPHVFTEQYQPLIDAFQNYKTTGILPTIFGREALLERPEKARSEEVFHIHLNLSGFPAKTRPYDRKSNIWLLYTRGFWDMNKYHLLAILEPDAHEQARKISFIGQFADLAEKFRENN